MIASAVLAAASSDTPATKTFLFGFGASGFSCAASGAARKNVAQSVAHRTGERGRKGATSRE